MPAPPITGQVVLDNIPLIVMPGSYAKGEDPLYGRAPLRLDSPVNLSPVSTFRQEGFIGGMGQEKWSDEEMYYLGDAETRDGWVQCKYELELISNLTTEDSRWKLLEIRAFEEGQLPRLYVATDGGSTLKRYNFQTGAETLAWTLPGANSITALGRSFYGAAYGLHIGTHNGDLYAIPTGSETVEAKPRITSVDSKITFLDSLGSRGDIAGTYNGNLWKTTSGTWVQFAHVDMPVYDGEQWNQRLWVVGNDGTSRSALYVTDTVTTQEVYRWPSAFVAKSIRLHGGALYVLGYTFDYDYNVTIGQVWSYNGSSMRLVFQVPDEVWRQTFADHPTWTNYSFITSTSYRKWLAFGFPYKAVWFYDPEQDAVHPGPPWSSPQLDGGNLPTGLVDYGGRLTVGLYNGTTIRHEPDTKHYKTSYLITSEYDAGLPSQLKSWIRARVRMKEPLPTGTTVQLYYTTQHIEVDSSTDPAWTSLGTATVGAMKTVLSFAGPPPIQSEVIRLLLKLTPTTNFLTTPRVTAIELDYMVVPDVKWSWSFQAVGAKGLVAPDGSAYQFADGDDLQVELENTRRDSAKKWVKYTDRDGNSYNVQIVSLTTYRRVLDPSNDDGETAIFSLTLAEV